MSLRIGILTEQTGYSKGFCDFYPLIKWKRELRDSGYEFKFFRSHKDKKMMDYDIVVIDHRYHMFFINQYKKYPNKDFIIKFIQTLSEQGIKVIFFDNQDGAGSRDFDLIPYVDRFVKKQLLNDKIEYTVDKGYGNIRVFTDKYNLSEEEKESNRKKGEQFVACPEEHLHKLCLGWNIGMLDYREFPFSQFYPTNRLLNSIYKLPAFTDPRAKKPIDSGFRGAVKLDKESYSWQRNQLIKFLKMNGKYHFKTGDGISKPVYLSELRKSKTCVSPFGYGEICYRDFEAILCGCVLIKPDMDHIETYPDVYHKGETYVDIQWDMDDLKEKLEDVIENYDRYIGFVKKSQEIYKKAISDSDRFIEQFKSILN